MRDRTYGLGIDVGDSTVVAAVCRHDGDRVGPPEPLALGRGAVPGSAAVALVAGRLSVLPPPGPGPAGVLVEHVLQRVGAPTPLVGGGGSASAAAAVAAIAARAHDLAARQEGSPAGWTVLTVPPSWSGHRRGLLAAALAAAGLPHSSVVSSAVAVVRAQVAAGALPAGSTVAVYDLGAGSLDTAVLRTTAGGGIEQLAVPPAPLAWGGRDLDDAVVGHVVRSLPGGAAPTHPAERAALRRACVAAKEALSTETDVRVDVQVDGVACAVRVVREDVEDSVADAVEASVDVVRSAVAAAGTTVADLDAVVLAGGSSRVPLVAETLSAELGRPLLGAGEPALSAASGAAQLALERSAEVPVDDGPGEQPAGEPAEPAADEPAGDHFDTAAEPLPRRTRRTAVVGAPAAGSRRHLQRAAVLTTAVLALWAGSASLVAVLDPDGSGPTLGGTTAVSGDEPAPGRVAPLGAPAAESADGELASGPLTPAALEAPADGDRRATRPADPAAPASAARAAAGTTRGTTSAPPPSTPAGTPGASGGATGAPAPLADPAPSSPSAPSPVADPGPDSTPSAGPPPLPDPPTQPEPSPGPGAGPGSGADQDPDPAPGPTPGPVTSPPTVPDPEPDATTPATSPADDTAAAAGQEA